MRAIRAENLDFKTAALDHLDSLYGYAMALTRDTSEAEDLVQETYLRATRAFGTLVPDSNLKSWLFTIMRNVWLNQLRHIRSGPRFVGIGEEDADHSDWIGTSSADPHLLLVRKIEREEVRAAIESLPRTYREVVVLRDLEGFSYQEIANILECPAGTVMSRLGRAREKLRHALGGLRADAAAGVLKARGA
jgi:RNA polymerase sigma-70 factor (ECF subfamily)